MAATMPPDAGSERASLEAADVVVGHVVRPFGRRGEVVIEPLTDDVRRFFDFSAVDLGLPGREGVRRAVESVRLLKGRPVVRFAGASDIPGAEALRGQEVRIHASERAAPPEDHYYLDDLVGCVAQGRDGRRLGEITGVEDTAGPSLLVLRDDRGAEHLVPFVEALCVEVDAPGALLVMDLPEGLLGLNDRAGTTGS